MALTETQKKILKLRFDTDNIKEAKKADYQDYHLSKKQIVERFADEGKKISTVEITEFLRKKLGHRKSLDYGGEEKRTQVRGRATKFYRIKDGIELKHQFGLYMYWYLFLQLAIKEKRKIDWSKYEEWGDEKSIAKTEWRDWWEEHKLLFDLRTNNGKLKYEMILKKPRYESIYYSYKVYNLCKMHEEKKDKTLYDLGLELDMDDALLKRKQTIDFTMGSTWKKFKEDKLKEIKKNGSDADLEIHQKFNDDEWARVYKKDLDYIEEKLVRRRIKKQMFNFKHRAKRILEGVCKGKFPEQRGNW